jgi:hypothetical protein
LGHDLKRLIYLALAFLLLAAAAQAPESETVVAVGDIHGNLEGLVSILAKTGLIDEARHWSGGRATLVQTGDFLDRGPKSRAVMDLLMTLQNEARRSGGAVRISLGNHEFMNLVGDLQDVVPADYAAFADTRSEQRRKTAFQNFSEQQKERQRSVDESEWMESHPPGFIEHREAFGPEGRYGRWLRSLPVVNVVGDSIFLHGGIHPELANLTADGINSSVSAEVQAFDQFRRYMIDSKLAFPYYTLIELIGVAEAEAAALQARPPSVLTRAESRRLQALDRFLQLNGWLSFHPNGPLWFRGFERWQEAEGQSHMDRLTAVFGVKRFVVGHSPQRGEIRRRFGGKAFLIDTGMLSTSYPGGRPSALEISKVGIRAIYLDGQRDLN